VGIKIHQQGNATDPCLGTIVILLLGPERLEKIIQGRGSRQGGLRVRMDQGLEPSEGGRARGSQRTGQKRQRERTRRAAEKEKYREKKGEPHESLMEWTSSHKTVLEFDGDPANPVVPQGKYTDIKSMRNNSAGQLWYSRSANSRAVAMARGKVASSLIEPGARYTPESSRGVEFQFAPRSGSALPRSARRRRDGRDGGPGRDKLRPTIRHRRRIRGRRG